MANTSALKKKGDPPKRAQGQNIVASDPRPSEGKNKPLQLMVPPEVFDAFSSEAGQRYGFTKGAKSRLFLEMWEAYKNS